MTNSAERSYRVEFDWRGETAYYVEDDRRVTLSAIYWGGPKGSVAHQYGVWEYPDNRRELMTAAERARVLERVIERAAKGHDITLEASSD